MAYEELKLLFAAFYARREAAAAAAARQASGSGAGGSDRRSPGGDLGPVRGRASQLGPWDHIAMGGLSKAFASTATYPLQVIRSRLQQRGGGGDPPYKGMADVVRRTWAAEGVAGFYRGIVPNVLRVMPASAVTFAAYEAALRVLSDDGGGAQTSVR